VLCSCLSGLSLPMLVIYGENDNSWSPAAQGAMARRLGARRVCIPGVVHSPAVEARDHDGQRPDALLGRSRDDRRKARRQHHRNAASPRSGAAGPVTFARREAEACPWYAVARKDLGRFQLRGRLCGPQCTQPSAKGAVGTALTGGPPHRSQRAGLPHWAPTLGVWRRSGPEGMGA
jgi:hypothetical protein